MSDAQSFVEGWSRVWRGRDSDPELYMELLHEGCPLINPISTIWREDLLGVLLRALGPGTGPRHVGTLEPVWNLFDLIREGRPAEFDEQLSYERDRNRNTRPLPPQRPCVGAAGAAGRAATDRSR